MKVSNLINAGATAHVQLSSHADTVVWECCKDDQQSQWEMLKSDPQLPLNPLSDRHQIWHAWLRHGYLSPSTKWAQSVKGFLLPIYAKYTPPCSLRYATLRYATLYACYYFFWFFQLPTAETRAWILTLKTSNDAVLCKEVPFGGYKSEIRYLTEFYGKFGKITIVSMGKSLNGHKSGCI